MKAELALGFRWFEDVGDGGLKVEVMVLMVVFEVWKWSSGRG